jgi:hypothetical protein
VIPEQLTYKKLRHQISICIIVDVRAICGSWGGGRVMVLLHYLVVPGLGDDSVPRSAATAVHADEGSPADPGVTAAAVAAAVAAAPVSVPCPPAEAE